MGEEGPDRAKTLFLYSGLEGAVRSGCEGGKKTAERGKKSTSLPFLFTTGNLKPMLEWEGTNRKSIRWEGGTSSKTSSCEMEVQGAARINAQKITTGPQKKRRKVWTRLKNGLFGWRIVRGTEMNNEYSAIPKTQQKTSSTIFDRKSFRLVTENVSNTSDTKKNITGEKKGFPKRKMEVGVSDQTGGNRNLRWKSDLNRDLDTDLVGPDDQAT